MWSLAVDCLGSCQGFSGGSAGKESPAVRETWVPSLGWEDPLEKGKAPHSSILAWRIPWAVKSRGSWRVGHGWSTFTSLQDKRSLFFLSNPAIVTGCENPLFWSPSFINNWGFHLSVFLQESVDSGEVCLSQSFKCCVSSATAEYKQHLGSCLFLSGVSPFLGSQGILPSSLSAEFEQTRSNAYNEASP